MSKRTAKFRAYELYGLYYIAAPSNYFLAMTPQKPVADLIVAALNASKRRTAILLRQGWTFGRDGVLYPPKYKI